MKELKEFMEAASIFVIFFAPFMSTAGYLIYLTSKTKDESDIHTMGRWSIAASVAFVILILLTLIF